MGRAHVDEFLLNQVPYMRADFFFYNNNLFIALETNMRNIARIKLGYYPLPQEGKRLEDCWTFRPEQQVSLTRASARELRSIS